MERMLPSNVDAERYVLGSILLCGNEQYELAAAMSLAAGDFSIDKHSRIFQRMGQLAARAERIDRVTVANELMRYEELEACGGLSYLVSLDDGLPQIVNLESYIRIVKEMSTLRLIMFTTQHMMNLAAAAEEESAVILGRMEGALLNLLSRAQSRCEVHWASNLVSRVLDDATARARKWEETGVPVMGVSTGLRGLDEILNGFQAGYFYTLAGGPGFGKTSLAIQFAREACPRGCPCVYVAYENSRRISSPRYCAPTLAFRLVRLSGGVRMPRNWRSCTRQARSWGPRSRG